MARHHRLHWSGAVFHVMSRGNRKGPIFDDDIDRRYFDEAILETVVRYGIRPYALCQMTTHYHFVFETPRDNLSDAMRHLNGLVAQSSNRRHGRTGHLFEARFRSLLIQRETYLRRAVRYVVLNPLEAHIVSRPEDWPWSTYRATAGLEPAPAWLHLDWLDVAFGATTRAESQAKFREYVNLPSARGNKVDTRALAYGSDAFREWVARTAAELKADRALPRGGAAPSRPPLEEILDASARTVAERDALMVTAHATHGYHLAEIARHLNLDPSTVSRAVSRVRCRGLRASRIER